MDYLINIASFITVKVYKTTITEHLIRCIFLTLIELTGLILLKNYLKFISDSVYTVYCLTYTVYNLYVAIKFLKILSEIETKYLSLINFDKIETCSKYVSLIYKLYILKLLLFVINMWFDNYIIAICCTWIIMIIIGIVCCDMLYYYSNEIKKIYILLKDNVDASIINLGFMYIYLNILLVIYSYL